MASPHADPADPEGLALGAEAAAPVAASGWTEVSLALMVCIWGINYSVVKWALGAFAPLAFNALRYLLASLFVCAVLRTRGQLRLPAREDVPRIVGLGVVGNVLYQLAFILGLARTRAGNAALMLALVPVFIALFASRGGERSGRRVWAGIGLSVLGVALVSGSTLRIEGGSTLAGDLILLGGSAFWALYTVGSRPIVQRYGAIQSTAWTLWVGGAVLVLIGAPALLRQRWDVVPPLAWAGLFFSAFLSIGLAYLLWYRGVERLGSTRTAVYSNLTPVVALVTGAVVLGERPTVVSLGGVLLTLSGLALVRTG